MTPDQFLAIFMRNDHRFALYHFFVFVQGAGALIRPAAHDRGSRYTVARSEEMNNFNLSFSAVSKGSNKCSISALIGSRDRCVTTTAESSLPTGRMNDWTDDEAGGEEKMAGAAAEFMHFYIYLYHQTRRKM